MRFINDKIHGVIDYAAAAALLVAPFALGSAILPPTARWLSVGAGVALLIYSLITGYSYSARQLISFRLHLVLDFLAGVAFVGAPLLLGFTGGAAIYFIAMGSAFIGVAVLTDPNTQSEPSEARRVTTPG